MLNFIIKINIFNKKKKKKYIKQFKISNNNIDQCLKIINIIYFYKDNTSNSFINFIINKTM